MRTASCITIILVITAVFSTDLQAGNQYSTWDGAPSDAWTNAANWASGLPDDVLNNQPGDTWTARIWNDTGSTPSVPNNTVLHSGNTATLYRVWLGVNGSALESGNLTIESGAELDLNNQIILRNSSTLSSAGLITTPDDIALHNNSTFTNTGTVSCDEIWIYNDSSASISGVATGDVTLQNSASIAIVVGAELTGFVKPQNTSSFTIDGTVNGDLTFQSTATNRIGATGFINGHCMVSTDHKLVIAGTVTNAEFACNQTSEVIIEPTAKIYSSGGQCWLYQTADVTWMVGEDGSIGTLHCDRNTDGTYDDPIDDNWRYTGSASLTVDISDYDAATYGDSISLQLVGNIENDANGGDFATGVDFVLNGEAFTDFVYDGPDTGSFTLSNIPLDLPQGTVIAIQ